MKELAVIIPAWNGGPRLLESVESCARSGVPAERYGLLVIDNCSTDDSIEKLPASDANHVPVQIWRNESNLGRTGNWNRGLEIAAREGYQFATFLFVGDTWATGASIVELLDLMKQSGAVLGMAPLLIAAESGSGCREGARISFPHDRALIDTLDLLEIVVRNGRLPFAPLQANIYRLFGENPLRFDTSPQSALNTDIESTVSYLMEHGGTIALISKPFLVWKEQSQRFLSRQDPWFVMLETRASLSRISAATGLPVDWAKANAISLLTSAHELSRRLSPGARVRLVWKVLRYLRRAPGGVSIREVLGFACNKVLRNRSYLWLSDSCTLGPSGRLGSAGAVSRYTL
jgi:hypothetical protein